MISCFCFILANCIQIKCGEKIWVWPKLPLTLCSSLTSERRLLPKACRWFVYDLTSNASLQFYEQKTVDISLHISYTRSCVRRCVSRSAWFTPVHHYKVSLCLVPHISLFLSSHSECTIRLKQTQKKTLHSQTCRERADDWCFLLCFVIKLCL